MGTKQQIIINNHERTNNVHSNKKTGKSKKRRRREKHDKTNIGIRKKGNPRHKTKIQLTPRTGKPTPIRKHRQTPGKRTETQNGAETSKGVGRPNTNTNSLAGSHVSKGDRYREA